MWSWLARDRHTEGGGSPEEWDDDVMPNRMIRNIFSLIKIFASFPMTKKIPPIKISALSIDLLEPLSGRTCCEMGVWLLWSVTAS